jgi:hypothetical protein
MDGKHIFHGVFSVSIGATNSTICNCAKFASICSARAIIKAKFYCAVSKEPFSSLDISRFSVVAKFTNYRLRIPNVARLNFN